MRLEGEETRHGKGAWREEGEIEPARDQERAELEAPASSEAEEQVSTTEEPDVLLHVPQLSVDEISLEVDDLEARVSLHAAVGNLVALDVGADVHIGQVKLGIKGVEAQALLKVRLEKVYAILERTLATIDKNPEILASLLKPVGEAVGAVGRTVEQTVPELGESVGRTVEQTVPAVGQSAASAIQSLGETVEQAAPVIGRATSTLADRSGESTTKPTERIPHARPDLEAGAGRSESLILYDGGEEPLRRWSHVGGGWAERRNGDLYLVASDEPGLLYFTERRFDDFTLRLQFRPDPGASMGVAVRFRDPTEPVPDRADPERRYQYDNPAFVAIHTGFEVQLGQRGPALEPGTFKGVLVKHAQGAQAREERPEVIAEEWNELEVSVRGDEFVARLNGRQTARFTNSDPYRGQPAAVNDAAGFVGLLLYEGGVSVRRVEVELERTREASGGVEAEKRFEG